MITIDKSNSRYVVISFIPAVKKFNVLIADKIKKTLIEVLDEDCPFLILDLENITYIDSSGFGVLISLFNYAKTHGKSFIMCSMSESNMKLVKITKLDNVFNICVNRTAAIEETI